MLNASTLAKDLSVNNIDRQPDLAQDDDGCGQMVEREEGVLELLVAHQELPEPVEPAMAGFDHPAARLLPGVSFLLIGFALSAHHMRDVAMGQDDPHGVPAPVPGVSAQVLGAALLGKRALDHDGVQHGLELRHIMRVGSCHDERQGDPTPVHQKVALAAFFSPDPSGCAPPPPGPGAP